MLSIHERVSKQDESEREIKEEIIQGVSKNLPFVKNAMANITVGSEKSI